MALSTIFRAFQPVPRNGCDSRPSQTHSTTAIIVVDPSCQPLYYSPEALKILRFSSGVKRTVERPSLPDEIQLLLRRISSITGSSSVQFVSGRRKYLCRSLLLVDNSGETSGGVAALLIERLRSQPVDLCEAAEQFRLTQRERQMVFLLTLGLTSKEIAERMNISPNTVKAFVRIVMTKMSVNTRSGIVGRLAGM